MNFKKLSLLLGFAALLPASAVFADVSNSGPAIDTTIRLAQQDRDRRGDGDRRGDEDRVSGTEVRNLIRNGRGRIDSFEKHRMLRRDDGNGFRQRLNEIEQRYMSQRDRRGNLRGRDSEELLAAIRVVNDEATQVAGDASRRPGAR